MLRKISLALMLCSILFVLSASNIKASDWPSRDSNITLNRNVVDPTTLNSVVPAYSLDVPFNTQEIVTGDGRLYYADGTGKSTVYAVSLTDKRQVWSKQFNNQVIQMVFSSGKLYLGSDKFYALDAATGIELWSAITGKTNTNIPYIARVYAVDDGAVYGFRWDTTYSFFTILNKNNGAYIYKSSIGLIGYPHDVGVTHGKAFVTEGQKLHSFDLTPFTHTVSTQICRDPSVAMLIDEEFDTVYLTGLAGAICSYKIDTLAPVIVNKMENLQRFVRYNDRYYSTWGTKFKSMTAGSTSGIVASSDILKVGELFSGDPLVVNGTLYAGTSLGGVWSKNLETGLSKYNTVQSGYGIRQMIYSSGYIISIAAASNNLTKIVFSDINNLMAAPTYQISVSSPYNTAGMNQYLGQLHAHVETETQLDWMSVFKTPPTSSDVMTRYKNAGYDFVALTEHNKVLPNPAVTGILNIESAEEITQDVGGDHILAIGIHDQIAPTGTDQERIDAVNAQGGIPILAHPNAKPYPFSNSALINDQGYHHLEIFNTGIHTWKIAYLVSGSAFGLDKWDYLLSRNKPIFGTADDDYTPYDGGFDGGSVIVFSSSNTQQDILANLKMGNFYAVQGSAAPRLNIVFDSSSNTIAIVSDKESNYRFVGRDGKILKTDPRVGGSTYSIRGDEGYVRAEVESSYDGSKAWTQPYFVSSRANISGLSAGIHDVQLQGAAFHIDTTGISTIGPVPVDSLPATLPPAGHLSSVYSLQTTGTVNSGTTLTYSFQGINLPTDPKNLSLYTYNQPADKWEPIMSTVDLTARTVTAALPHFSMYTLSATMPEDAEAPLVELSQPTDLSNLNGTVNLSATASDNQAVTEVQFVVDNKDVGSDISGLDGWNGSFDSSEFAVGAHKLAISAEDFIGNRTEKIYDINVVGGIAAPAISILAPADGDYLYDPSVLTGSYTSKLSVASVGVYIDDIFIANADINTTDKTISKSMNWTAINEGAHKLKLELLDAKDNLATAEIDIIVGQNVTATIVSPTDKGYLRGDTLPINISTTPPNANIVITVDGAVIANNTNLDISNYVFGQHKIEAKFKDKIIATASFSVVTTYEDTIAQVKKLYTDGHMKNYGISKSITVQLLAAQLLHNLHLCGLEKSALNELEDFVVQLSKQKKPLIDGAAKSRIVELISYLRDPS